MTTQDGRHQGTGEVTLLITGRIQGSHCRSVRKAITGNNKPATVPRLRTSLVVHTAWTERWGVRKVIWLIKDRVDGCSERGATRGSDEDTSTTFKQWGAIPYPQDLWGAHLWYPFSWHTNSNNNYLLLSHPPLPFLLLLPWGVFQCWNLRTNKTMNSVIAKANSMNLADLLSKLVNGV